MTAHLNIEPSDLIRESPRKNPRLNPLNPRKLFKSTQTSNHLKRLHEFMPKQMFCSDASFKDAPLS